MGGQYLWVKMGGQYHELERFLENSSKPITSIVNFENWSGWVFQEWVFIVTKKFQIFQSIKVRSLIASTEIGQKSLKSAIG